MYLDEHGEQAPAVLCMQAGLGSGVENIMRWHQTSLFTRSALPMLHATPDTLLSDGEKVCYFRYRLLESYLASSI
jgi:hypothetical protein